VFGELGQDLRYGFRSFIRNPSFTLVAILALAIGIGANTAIFSVVSAMILRPLPYEGADRLVWVWGNNSRLGITQSYLSNADIYDFEQHSTTIESIAGWTTMPINLLEDGTSERLEGILVSPKFFSSLGVSIKAGRDFQPQEVEPGQNLVAIISDNLWHRRFGSDPNIIGRRITLDRNDAKTFMIIGVAPPEVQFPSRTDVWMPTVRITDTVGRGGHDLRGIARLKPGVTMDQAQSELNVLAQNLERQYPESNDGWRVSLTSVRDVVLGTPYKGLWLLLAAVCCVLLIACANVASLQLARSTSRSREIVLRAALGAGRIRIIRQLLAESLLLSFIGGVSGLLLAWGGVFGLRASGPASISRLGQATVNGWVLAYTGLVIVVVGITSGLIPALQSSRFDLNGALREGPRGSTGSAGKSRMHSVLLIAEIAVATLLLVGAGLLLKSFWRLQSVDPGFKPDHVLTAGISLNREKYMKDDDRRVVFFRQILERVKSVPGVESVGMISHLPFSGRGVNMGFTIAGQPVLAGDDDRLRTELRVISPEYFRTMSIPVRNGRVFAEQDTKSGQTVAVVNDAFVRQFFPDRSPLGERVQIAYTDPLNVQVVGVVGDVRHRGYDADARPELYVSYQQDTIWPVMNLVIRTQGEPLTVAANVRHEIDAVDPSQAIFNVRPLEELMFDSIAERRFNLILLLAFAVVAVLTAAAGIYGIMTYFVSQRTSEIGIRMALGARRLDVLKLILGHGMRLTMWGVGIGLLASLIVTRLIVSLLFGVSAIDPLTLAGVAIFLTFVALLACYVPTQRAIKVDPLIAIREP
jgi:putative ABC transport system permease protein